MMSDEITESSGNVFADLGLRNPEKDLLKANLVHTLANIIRGRGLSQMDASRLLKTDQSKISAILGGRISGFSTDRLLRYLSILGHDVNISVHRQEVGRGSVTVELV